ncbi:hypothetical protein E4U14_005156 [Claviceps sp. LM454 group G7]|nr:hypothetical protein E4U14_005156 [Claviceps sp. LM454 group G7]
MRKASDSHGAKSRKRRRESASDGEEGSTSARQERHSVQSTAKPAAIELEDAKSMITARMPIELLSTTWTLGSNRPLDRRHVQRLRKAFVELGGPKRDLEEHHLRVLCTGAEVERMLKKLGLQDGAKQAEGMPNFAMWPKVNGRAPLELLAGQHRIRALEEWVKVAKLGEEELWWPCKFYDRDSISLEQNMKLRVNKRDVAQPDSHGDIWLHILTLVSHKPELFQGKASEIVDDMTNTLGLGRDNGVPMPRLVMIWRNEVWRAMATAWCKTALGRATFKITTWCPMITCRIDDFWFSIFRQVLDTLADLPGDAASYVNAEDWRQISKFLGHSQSEIETREFFYPGVGSKNVDPSSRRRRDFLVGLDDKNFFEVYRHVYQRKQISFPDVHLILGLSEHDQKMLRGVMDHVVDWISSDRSKRLNKRNNKKPGLRVDMIAALQHLDEEKLHLAKDRVSTSIKFDPSQSVAEAASIFIQQEVLEFVCRHLETFRSAPVKNQLTQRLEIDKAGLYRTRFRQAEWAGVLDIVRWYMGPDFRPEWPRLEESQPEDVSHLVDMAIQHWRDTLEGDEMRCSKVSSASFRDNMASWLAEQFGAVEESNLSGPTTGEANADAESTACTSAVSIRRYAGGEEVNGDPVRASDSAMTQREPLPPQLLYNTPPSGQLPDTTLEDRGEDFGMDCDTLMTQKDPVSPQSPYNTPPSGQLPDTMLEDRGEEDFPDLSMHCGISMTQKGPVSPQSPYSTPPSGQLPDTMLLLEDRGEEDFPDLGMDCDTSMTQQEPVSSPSPSCLLPPSRQPTAGTDARGEDDDLDLDTEDDLVMAKSKNKIALSVPTQQEAPAEQRRAQPLSVQSPSHSPSSRRRQVTKTKLDHRTPRATPTPQNRMTSLSAAHSPSASEAKISEPRTSWRYGLKAMPRVKSSQSGR